MGYKNMKKQKAHIKNLRRAQKNNLEQELTERNFREIENSVSIIHDSY